MQNKDCRTHRDVQILEVGLKVRGVGLGHGSDGGLVLDGDGRAGLEAVALARRVVVGLHHEEVMQVT
jgi:hypothetical protein